MRSICLALALMCPPPAQPAGAPTLRTYTYRSLPDGRLDLTVHRPAGWSEHDRRPAIVFFFGGGWTSGDIRQFADQADHLARRGMVAIRADYRVKSRQGVKPDKCVEDARSAIRWVRAHASTLGIDPARIAAAGGSAGGHLAACTSIAQAPDAPGDDLSVSCRPDALVLFNPVLRFEGVPELMARIDHDAELGKKLSPTLHLTAQGPPTLILFGTSDRLYAQGREFMSRAREVGLRAELYTAPGQPHGFFNRPPWKLRTTTRTDEFLDGLGYFETAKQPAPAAP